MSLLGMWLKIKHTKYVAKKLCCVLLGIIFILIASQPAFAKDKNINVLINSSVSNHDIGAVQLRSIFSKRKTSWFDGQKVTVFVLKPSHPSHQSFCKENLKMFPYQIERIWEKLVYSGVGEKPIEVSSEQEMLARVSEQPGAIGYVSSDFYADATLPSGIFVLGQKE